MAAHQPPDGAALIEPPLWRALAAAGDFDTNFDCSPHSATLALATTPASQRDGGLSTPRAPAACARVCGSGAPLRPFPAPAAPRVSRSCGAASFLGRPLRVAFF